MADISALVQGFKKGVTEMPQISEQIVDSLERGWFYATLFFGEAIPAWQLGAMLGFLATFLRASFPKRK